jgi:hypothetical protein
VGPLDQASGVIISGLLALASVRFWVVRGSKGSGAEESGQFGGVEVPSGSLPHPPSGRIGPSLERAHYRQGRSLSRVLRGQAYAALGVPLLIQIGLLMLAGWRWPGARASDGILGARIES